MQAANEIRKPLLPAGFSSLYDLVPQRVGHCRSDIGHAQLLDDIAAVGVYGLLGDIEQPGYLV